LHEPNINASPIGWQVESWLIVESAQALAAYCILLADAAVDYRIQN